jgi:hypothetical protein
MVGSVNPLKAVRVKLIIDLMNSFFVRKIVRKGPAEQHDSRPFIVGKPFSDYVEMAGFPLHPY